MWLRTILASTLPVVFFLSAPPEADAPKQPSPPPKPVATGRIEGHVLNERGEAFGFVQVVLEPEAGYTFADSTLTEEEGTFRFMAVPVGNYRLSAFSDGYKARESIVNIAVTAGSAQAFTITLTLLPAVTETIVVCGKIRDFVDTRKTDTSSTLDARFIGKIPLQNKRVQDVVFLHPGATRSGSSDSKDISIGGGISGQIAYRTEGMGINDAVNGGALVGVPTAAIQSFKVIAGGFSAEHGEQSSGIARIVSSPGAVEAPSREAYAHRDDNPFRRSLDEPLSTFAVDVDTASYSNVRRFLRDGQLPPPDAVRVEEMINYFRYDDPAPHGDQPFAIATEVASCPWAHEHRLLRIALTSASMDDRAMPKRSLVFLIDVSGSMSSQDKLPLVKDSLRMLASRLRPEDEVGLVVYAGAAGLVLPLTNASDKATILAAIDRLDAGGSTNGGDGIRLAYELAEQAQHEGAISRVILATDGDFNVGTTSEGELVRLIEKEREKGVFLTVLGYGTGNLQDATMEALADHGNGNYAYIDSIDEATKVLDREASATLVTVAKDVKIQVEFNPGSVEAWRLVGYENRLLAAQDFDDDRKDAGEIGAGHHVTALYEIVPAGGRAPIAALEPLRYRHATLLTDAAGSGEMALVRLRYKPPTGSESRLLEKTVVDRGDGIDSASESLRFASAVASFGMLLRGSSDVTWPQVIKLARASGGADPDGTRKGFVTLVERAREIAGREGAGQ